MSHDLNVLSEVIFGNQDGVLHNHQVRRIFAIGEDLDADSMVSTPIKPDDHEAHGRLIGGERFFYEKARHSSVFYEDSGFPSMSIVARTASGNLGAVVAISNLFMGVPPASYATFTIGLHLVLLNPDPEIQCLGKSLGEGSPLHLRGTTSRLIRSCASLFAKLTLDEIEQSARAHGLAVCRAPSVLAEMRSSLPTFLMAALAASIGRSSAA